MILPSGLNQRDVILPSGLNPASSSDMAPSVLLLPILLALWAAPATAGGNFTVFVVSKTGVMHLDSNGTLLAWRPDTDQRGPVAINPRNNTVCWTRYPKDPELGGIRSYVIRCAELARLNQTWDIPLPLSVRPDTVKALTYDDATNNWHLTVREALHPLHKDGVIHYDVHSSYVCDAVFGKCLQLIEEVPGEFAKFQAAYDSDNRILSYITTEEIYTYRLKLMQLDGSGARIIDTHIRHSHGMALDPIGRRVYWLNRPAIYGNYTDVNRASYDGQSSGRVKRVYDYQDIKAIDALDGRVALVRKNRTVVSVLDTSSGVMTDLVSGAVRGGEEIPALADARDLLTAKIIPDSPIPEPENSCSSAATSCQDFCIPTMNNGTPAATCLCPEGLQLVDLGCRKEQPSFVLLVGADKLQAVDLRTEEVSTILSNLTDGSRVEAYRPAGESDLLLYWVDAGSLFSGRWTPGGFVTHVQLLVPATDKDTVVEVAVYSSQRQLFWIKKVESDDGSGSNMVVQMSPLDNFLTKTVLMDRWEEQQHKIVHGLQAFLIMNNRFVKQRSYWARLSTFKESICQPSPLMVSSPGNQNLGGIVMDEPLSPSPDLERIWWVDRSSQSIQYTFTFEVYIVLFAKAGVFQLLSHPSLSDAGGLDTTDSRLFWTERSTGRLWSADKETGEVRQVADSSAGRSLRLVQPWVRPTAVPVCDDGKAGCSHFCIRHVQRASSKSAEAKCFCPDGMRLGEDSKTCQNDTDVSGKSGEFPKCHLIP